jgi:hypothetical protein
MSRHVASLRHITIISLFLFLTVEYLAKKQHKFSIKRCSVRLYLQLFVGGKDNVLFMFFVVVPWCPTHCSVFVFLLCLSSSSVPHTCCQFQEEFVLTKGVIKIRKSKKDRQTLNHFEIKLSQHAHVLDNMKIFLPRSENTNTLFCVCVFALFVFVFRTPYMLPVSRCLC